MALKDFTYEMVVPNEDLPCKFFIFEGKMKIFSDFCRTYDLFCIDKVT